MHRIAFLALIMSSMLSPLTVSLQAQDAAVAEDINSRVDRSAKRGIVFLRNRGQADDGSFSSETGVAVTALCVRAMLEHQPGSVDAPHIKKALKFIESRIQGDGGIYTKGSLYRNYETSVSVGALIKANKDGRYESALKRAEAFLKDIQWDEG